MLVIKLNLSLQIACDNIHYANPNKLTKLAILVKFARRPTTAARRPYIASYV